MKRILVGQDQIVAAWVCARTGGMPHSGMTCIGLLEGEELIAGVIYESCNGANVNMHIAAKGRNWLNREFLHYAFYYPFIELGVRRVTGLVPAHNVLARRFDEHLGFREEARLVGACPTGDLIVYRMFPDECRWLNLKEQNNVQRRKGKQAEIA